MFATSQHVIAAVPGAPEEIYGGLEISSRSFG